MTQALSQITSAHLTTNRRLVELDWLRVLVFGVLIFYHVGMLYAEGWGWHYKSTYASKFITNIMLWSNQWRMSLLFLISGAAVSFLIVKQARWSFFRQRVPLLLLPLVFGVLVVVVPQVYVEGHSKGLIDVPNYWQFWYAYLNQSSPEFVNAKTLGKLHLTWNHLWFLPYVLAYTLLIWLVYPLLTLTVFKPVWQSIAKRTSIGLVVFAPVMLFYINGWWLHDKYPVTHNFVEDWFNHGRSLISFLLGFALVRMPHIWSQFASLRWHLLPAALLSYGYALFVFNGGSLGEGSLVNELNGLLWSANGWMWILTIIAWAQHWFTSSNSLLRYLNRGVYCFYILHQTLIIIIAFYLVPRKLGPVIEPLLVITCVTFLCLALFEVIKRLPLLSIFFGIHRSKGAGDNHIPPQESRQQTL